MANQTSWHKIELTSADRINQVCAALESGPLAGRATLLNDPRWIAWRADNEAKSGRVYARHEHGALAGLATFLMHPSALPLALGEVTFFSHPVRRLYGFAVPLADGGGDRDREIASLTELLASIRADLDNDEVVFLESVTEGTAMFELISGATRPVGGFHVFQNGSLYQHRYAVVPDSFENYLKHLGGRTRADLRTNRKRFIAHVERNYRTRCFRSNADVPEFLADAMEVSRSTHQYRLLGAGLREREALEPCYLGMASLGWFRSYVLYAKERPVAFQVGCVYRGRYYAQEIGYDPEWARHHVGIFLHTEIIADLAASNGEIREFDFGNGDTLHKQRLSTSSHLEGYFYLIPTGFKNYVMVNSMRATHQISSALGSIFGRFGMRRKARDLLRKLGFSR